MKKKHGWVRQANNTGRYVMSDGRESKTIRKAVVFSTRKEAHMSKTPHLLKGIDITHKVELLKNGKAKKVIPGR